MVGHSRAFASVAGHGQPRVLCGWYQGGARRAGARLPAQEGRGLAMLTMELLYQDEPISERGNQYLAACHVANWAVRAYFAAAFSNNVAMARYDSPVYKHLRAAAIAAIREAYGMSALMAGRVLDVISDQGTYHETLAVPEAVSYVRSHRTSSAYSR